MSNQYIVGVNLGGSLGYLREIGSPIAEHNKQYAHRFESKSQAGSAIVSFSNNYTSRHPLSRRSSFNILTVGRRTVNDSCPEILEPLLHVNH